MTQKKDIVRATAVFDLDGTLLDTLGDLADAINSTMRAFGYPEKTDAQVLAAIGNGIKRAIEAVLPGEPDAQTTEAALALFRKEYEKCYLNRTRPYPGVIELLQTLRGAGYGIAVISNKSDSFTAGLVEKHFGGLVDAAFGERPGVPLKPAPDAVFEVIAAAGGAPGRAVYIGDSEVDAATARNAGMPCVLVSWGFRGRDSLIGAGAAADSIVDTAGEVLAKIYAQLPAV